MYNHKDGMCVRKLTREDLPILLDLKNESWWGTHNTLVANLEDQLRWYEGLSNNELCVMITSNGTPITVGVYSQIDWVSRTMCVSGSTIKAHRSPDLVRASFAAGLDFVFEILNMSRLSAEVLACNAAAQQLHLGYLGFKVEGCRRQAVYKSGRYYDSIMLGLLREEWEQQDRVVAYGGSCNVNFDHNLAAKFVRRFNRVKPDT